MKAPLLRPFFLLLLLASSGIYAQQSDIRNEYGLESDRNFRIGLSLDYSFASNALTNKIVTDYFLHRFITNSTKDAVSNNLDPVNRVGAGFHGNFDFLYRPDSSRIHYIFSLQHHLQLDSRFSDDLFELYFRGNKGFAGDTAHVDRTSMRLLFYYQAGVGAGGTSNSGNFNWYAIGSFLVGHDLLDINAHRGWLYTPNDGEYIDANLDLTFRQSDSAATQPSAVNGTGFGFTGGLSMATGDNGIFHLGARNLGFIHFFERSSYATIDTSLRFEGIDVSELFNLSDTVQSTITTDTAFVQRFIKNRDKRVMNIPTPGQVDLWQEQSFAGNKFSIALGTRFYVSQNALPLGWMEASVPLASWLTIRLRAQYGGYTSWVAGPGLEIHGGGWNIRAASDYLSGWINDGGGRSQGAYVSLYKSF